MHEMVKGKIVVNGVEDARLTSFIYIFRDVNQAFIDLTNHLRVNSDFLIERAILGNREVVAFEKVENLSEATI